MSDEDGNIPGRDMSPDKRRRLQKCFEHGTKLASSGNHDYATEMYTQCVVGDPGNQIYLQSFLGNLQRKYNNNKKGKSFAGMSISSHRSAAKKSLSKQDWNGVFKAGVEALKVNPWDVPTLETLGDASQECGFDECQLVYMKTALDADPKNPDVNRMAAKALARQGRFDDAIACWVRVQQAKPGDEEAGRAVADLTVEKTIAVGGYEKVSESKKDSGTPSEEEADTGDIKLTREQELHKAIKRNPADAAACVELAEILARKDEHAQAVKLLTTGLEASGGDLKIREMLEDIQLRHARRQIEVAEKKARQENTPEATKLLQRKKAEINSMELEVFRTRSERYPNNPTYKYELGVRLKRAGNFNEAIKSLQAAVNDPKNRGHVFLQLGECFQYIKQYKLALSNYVQAVESLSPERDLDERKRALYLAGKLATGLKEWAMAEKHLTALASLDFGYKDVADLLQKLSERDADGSGASG